MFEDYNSFFKWEGVGCRPLDGASKGGV